MASRFEAVTVQKLPASPVYAEHSLVTTSLPLRAADAEATASPLVRAPPAAGPGGEGFPLGLVGDAPPSAQAAKASAPAHRAPSATVLIVGFIRFSCETDG